MTTKSNRISRRNGGTERATTEVAASLLDQLGPENYMNKEGGQKEDELPERKYWDVV